MVCVRRSFFIKNSEYTRFIVIVGAFVSMNKNVSRVKVVDSRPCDVCGYYVCCVYVRQNIRGVYSFPLFAR